MNNQDEEVKDCSKFYKACICEAGHKFYKKIYCGKEYCVICGKDGSVSHMRRFARWLKKGFKFKIIACIVITFPVEYRKKLKSKENIKEIRKRLINLFKEWG
ncbi:MAG: hypothetical protein JSW62_04820, partial [Thermoplasmatales archaeon]